MAKNNGFPKRIIHELKGKTGSQKRSIRTNTDPTTTKQ
jgi:hypothetical protein